MKATAIYKKFIIASVLSGSFLVFGGIYQGMTVTDNSFMQQKDISFQKRIDENADRIVASSDRETIAVQYLPVAQYSEAINGKWEITRIEDSEGSEIHNNANATKKVIVDMELIGTGLVRINGNADYTFDVSFLHENLKNISIFRAYKNGYELMEARKINEVKKVANTEVTQELIEEVAQEEVVVATSQDRREFMIERAVMPQFGNKMVRGSDYLEGSVTVGPNGIEGLYFTVNSDGNEVNEVIGDIKLKDGNSFEVELQGQKSHGIFTRNGENGYRLRFATGPYKGALFNYVTYDELERINIEIENMERAKEESQFQKELTQEGSFENDINLSQNNVVSAGFKQPKVVKLEQQEEQSDEEFYQDEQLNDEYPEDMEREEEYDRQGYGF